MVMRDDSSLPQSILAASSLTGLNRLGKLESGYLTALSVREQPLCGNSEGWGPLSPIRYDFTPCFMDVWVSSVAVFGILGGAIAVWWLIKKKKAQEVSKDWHFWTKQVWTYSSTCNSEFHSISLIGIPLANECRLGLVLRIVL